VAVGAGAVVGVSVGVDVGDGAIAVGRTGTRDRTGVVVETTAIAVAGIDAVAGASSSTDPVQATNAKRSTAAVDQAVVSFKG
jgi:hypothetical protein